MKKSMKKFIVACAAVSAITVAAGVSAMAATYTADNNSVQFNNVPDADAGSQKTVLVIPADKKGNVAEEDILYINQDAALADTALLKGTEALGDGNYVVMVGYYKDGAFAISEDPFTIGDAPETHEVLIGNVTSGDSLINATDGSQVLRYAADLTVPFAEDKDKVIAANVTKGDTIVNATDGNQILRYAADLQTDSNIGKIAVVNANYEVVEVK